MSESEIKIKRSGFIGLFGRPNVGKSTLLNCLLGQKIAITSPKPQTTRNRIAGILNRGEGQAVFLDTPGVHLGGKQINRFMVGEALSCLSDVDAAVLIVDAEKGLRPDDELLIDHLKTTEAPIVLAANKCDVATKSLSVFSSLLNFHSEHLISALTGEGIEPFLETVFSLLPEGPEYYPEDMITDHSERFMAEEFIREKIFEAAGEEVPYSVAVAVEAWENKPEKNLTVIHAAIHVERDSQKQIIIGKGGSMIKKIGFQARIDLEALLETKVYLDLHVRVEKNWTKDPKALRRFGYGAKP